MKSFTQYGGKDSGDFKIPYYDLLSRGTDYLKIPLFLKGHTGFIEGDLPHIFALAAVLAIGGAQ